MKQYLNGITINDEVMKTINPLLVINGRVNINRGQMRSHVGGGQQMDPTVIDGNHMVSTRRVNTGSFY